MIFDGMMWLFTYGEISPRKYLHEHIKHKISKYLNIIYRSISVTKDFDNKHAILDITSIWERNKLCIDK